MASKKAKVLKRVLNLFDFMFAPAEIFESVTKITI